MTAAQCVLTSFVMHAHKARIISIWLRVHILSKASLIRDAHRMEYIYMAILNKPLQSYTPCVCVRQIEHVCIKET